MLAQVDTAVGVAACVLAACRPSVLTVGSEKLVQQLTALAMQLRPSGLASHAAVVAAACSLLKLPAGVSQLGHLAWMCTVHEQQWNPPRSSHLVWGAQQLPAGPDMSCHGQGQPLRLIHQMLLSI